MAKMERTIHINAPVEKVFGYMTEPTNLPEIWPSLVEVKDVKQLPEGVGAITGGCTRWLACASRAPPK
jgi:uncharacterized protein YndB with AHSA1/START domain